MARNIKKPGESSRAEKINICRYAGRGCTNGATSVVSHRRLYKSALPEAPLQRCLSNVLCNVI